ncbi:MAG: type II secretion system F family protein [Candidatus Micrarchaeota archaeon]
MKIPFSILPPKMLMNASKHFFGIGNFISPFFPFLRAELLQSGVELTPRQYASAAFVVALTNGVFITLTIMLIDKIGRLKIGLPIIVGLGLLIAFASLITVLIYPGVIAKRRARQLENNLIPALRQLLIELRSGVPLFQAMTSLTSGYGEVSAEFRWMVKQMNAGISETDVLTEATKRNPSQRFRRVLWQISNALKVGSDVANAIDGMINDLTKERVAEIQRYGQELNPWTMIYMIGAVVVPSLGVTMLIVILSFLNIKIPKIILTLVLVGLVMFQLFFISFVRSRRPAVD